MPYKFYCIPVRDDGTATVELNSFLCNHRVLTVERRWVDQGSESFWALCIDYLESSSAEAFAGRSSKPRGKDYKEILSPEDFATFAKLRELRKEIAQAEAVPVYTLFTNEQLANMVQSKAQSRTDLGKISGICSF